MRHNRVPARSRIQSAEPHGGSVQELRSPDLRRRQSHPRFYCVTELGAGSFVVPPIPGGGREPLDRSRPALRPRRVHVARTALSRTMSIGLLDLDPVRRSLRTYVPQSSRPSGRIRLCDSRRTDGVALSLLHQGPIGHKIIPHRPTCRRGVLGLGCTADQSTRTDVAGASTLPYGIQRLHQSSVDLILASLSSRTRQGRGRLMVGGQSSTGASGAPSAAGRARAEEL